MLKFWEYPITFKDPASVYAYFLITTHHDILWYLIIILVLVHWSLYKILRDSTWKKFYKAEGPLAKLSRWGSFANFMWWDLKWMQYALYCRQALFKLYALLLEIAYTFRMTRHYSGVTHGFIILLIDYVIGTLNYLWGFQEEENLYLMEDKSTNPNFLYGFDGKFLIADDYWLYNTQAKHALMLWELNGVTEHWDYFTILEIWQAKYVDYTLYNYTSNGLFYTGHVNIARHLERRSRRFKPISTLGLDVLLSFPKEEKLLYHNSFLNLDHKNSILRDTFFGVHSFKHNFSFELVWGIFPTIIIGLILVPSLYLLYSLDEDIDPKYTIKVIGHQWYWSYEFNNWVEISKDNFAYFRFDYNSNLIDTASLDFGRKRLLEVDNRLVLPINVPLRFLISSGDVLHSWSVPELGIKIDAVPGRLNQFNAFITRPGVFYGQCSEICGVNHGAMPIVVHGVPYKHFVTWLNESTFD